MQKTGQIERTVDREFTDEEAKFKTWVFAFVMDPVLLMSYRFEKECQALQKDSKGYLDAMRGQIWLLVSCMPFTDLWS